MQELSSKLDSSKSSPEGSSKSDSNKSDEDFVTASECTGTPPSRTSSYHTASEEEPASPWWDIDPSLSSENEVETIRAKIPAKQSSEVLMIFSN